MACFLRDYHVDNEVIEGPFTPAPNEVFVICPYDISHKILLNRLKYHLERCRRNYNNMMKAKKMAIPEGICRYNDFHKYPLIELPTHEKYCPEKLQLRFEMDNMHAQGSVEGMEEYPDAPLTRIDWGSFDGWKLADDTEDKSDNWSIETLNVSETSEPEPGPSTSRAPAVANAEDDVAQRIRALGPHGSASGINRFIRLGGGARFGMEAQNVKKEEERKGSDGDDEDDDDDKLWVTRPGREFCIKPEAFRCMPQRMSKTEKKAYHKRCTEGFAERLKRLNLKTKFLTEPKDIPTDQLVEPYLEDGGRGLANATAALNFKDRDGFGGGFYGRRYGDGGADEEMEKGGKDSV